MTSAPLQSDDQEGYKRRAFIDSRASFFQRLQWRLEAFAWDHIYWNRFSAMPVEKASNKGAALFRWLGPKIGKSAHRTATRNLKMVFPDWNNEQIEDTVLKSWENFGRIAGEMPHFADMTATGDDPRVIIHGADMMNRYRENKTSIVLFSGHLANWEIMTSAIVSLLPDALMTYRSVNNPHIDKRIAAMRLSTGATGLAAKKSGTRDLMRAMVQGRAIGLMNDQKLREGISVPFFGHDAMTADGPTRIAIRYKAPLVPVSTVRTGPARYEVTFHPPLPIDYNGPTEDVVFKTVKDINGFLEARIREHPEQWFWQHNRWPKEAWRDAGVI